MTELSSELKLASDLARRAGRILMEIYATDFTVDYKGKDDPVTEADRRANALIVEAIRSAFPGDAIVAEESVNRPESWVGKRRIWYIDPLDGTAQFVGRDGEFSAMIGLAIDGEARLGAVYQPIGDRLFAGVTGEGAWLESAGSRRELRVSVTGSLSKMRFVHTRSKRSGALRKYIDLLEPASSFAASSVGVKAGMIAADEADLYLEPSNASKHWDACAPDAILRAAGGAFTDMLGQPFRYGGPELRNLHGIAGSNGRCHDEMIQRIAPILDAEIR